MFADQCCDADSTGFYAGAAGMLAGFLVAQRAALQASGTIAPRTTPEGPLSQAPLHQPSARQELE
jgi:hypothetical protein